MADPIVARFGRRRDATRHAHLRVVQRRVALLRNHQSSRQSSIFPCPIPVFRVKRFPASLPLYSTRLTLVGLQRSRVGRYWITRPHCPRVQADSCSSQKGDATCTPNMKIIFPFGIGMIDIYSSDSRASVRPVLCRGPEISFGSHCARNSSTCSKTRSALYRPRSLIIPS